LGWRCRVKVKFGFLIDRKLLLTTPPDHNHFTILVRDHAGEPVPEENFWTLWCKGRLAEADTPTIRLGATPSGLSSADLHHHPTTINKI